MADAQRPNIILIMPDQHRADALGCAGNPVVTSPNIDRLASEGVMFRRAYSQSPLCQPARASLLTGRYPHQHGCLVNRVTFPSPSEPNFLTSLQEAGYHTASVGKVHIGVIPPGVDRHEYVSSYGIADLHEVNGKMAHLKMDSAYTDLLSEAGVLDEFRSDLRSRVAKMAIDEPYAYLTHAEVEGVEQTEPWFAGPAPVPEELFIDNYVGDLAVDWLRRYAREESFFFWIGFCGPHDPHDAPASYADPYLERWDELPVGSLEPPEPTPSERYNQKLDYFARYSGTGEMSADDVRRLRAYYYGNVSLIDDRIGDILDVLEERGMLDNTWIVFTSDHGDMLGDHQLLAKVVMYDGALRVPLIVRPPGGIAGLVTDDMVELGDAGATIVDAAGIDPIPSSGARSLVPYVTGDQGPPRDAVFVEVGDFSGVVTDRHKYIVERETRTPCVLFDRLSDPDEDDNMAATDPELEADLMRRYLAPFLAM